MPVRMARRASRLGKLPCCHLAEFSAGKSSSFGDAGLSAAARASMSGVMVWLGAAQPMVTMADTQAAMSGSAKPKAGVLV